MCHRPVRSCCLVRSIGLPKKKLLPQNNSLMVRAWSQLRGKKCCNRDEIPSRSKKHKESKVHKVSLVLFHSTSSSMSQRTARGTNHSIPVGNSETFKNSTFYSHTSKIVGRYITSFIPGAVQGSQITAGCRVYQ